MKLSKMLLSVAPSRQGALTLAALFMLAAAGCNKSPNAGGPGGGMPGGGAMPPTEVGVITISPEAVAMTVELPGRVNSVRVAEVRARATGILLKRRFEEGAEVTEGQVLFEIDPAPLQAARDSAKASLLKAEATLEQAQADARRKEALVKINGVSQQAYETAKATARQSEADVLSAKAALETAELNLGYAKVTAPISGRIGKALATEGALASATEATQLAVIKQLDPIFVDFAQSSAEMLKLKRMLDAGKMQGISPQEVKITLTLEDGSAYAAPGRLVFSDVTVSEQTGSYTLRGEFPNPDRLLMPGMFVRGQIEVAKEAQAITVPQRGVARDANGQTSVLLVNAQNQVEQRDIKISSAAGNKWIVASGLKAGDRVIIEGLQKVRPGSPANAVPFQAGGKPTGAAGAPAAATANH